MFYHSFSKTKFQIPNLEVLYAADYSYHCCGYARGYPFIHGVLETEVLHLVGQHGSVAESGVRAEQLPDTA